MNFCLEDVHVPKGNLLRSSLWQSSLLDMRPSSSTHSNNLRVSFFIALNCFSVAQEVLRDVWMILACFDKLLVTKKSERMNAAILLEPQHVQHFRGRVARPLPNVARGADGEHLPLPTLCDWHYAQSRVSTLAE